MFRFSAVMVLVVGASLPAVADSAAIMCQGSEVTIWGTTGNDRIVGTDGRDVIHGLDGDDVIKGFGANDIICGGSGDDTLLGGLGADLLQGGDGADLIKGGAGKDQLYGGPGDDILQGGPADDLLFGGAGLDSCYGGSQVDRADSCESPVATEVGDRPPVRSQPDPKAVALTFDDGPHPYYTPAVLDVLARYGVKATFFVVGAKAASYPGLIQRMISEGHSVQSHSYTHAWLTRYSDSVVSLEIARGREAIESACGIESRCLRPPFGRPTAGSCPWRQPRAKRSSCGPSTHRIGETTTPGGLRTRCCAPPGEATSSCCTTEPAIPRRGRFHPSSRF